VSRATAPERKARRRRHSLKAHWKAMARGGHDELAAMPARGRGIISGRESREEEMGRRPPACDRRSDVAVRLPAKRGPQRREAICDAVFALLAEVGYDRMTMDLVADRAHASKATIYRTWSDKPQMVVEAILQRFDGVPEIPDTGSLRGDLMAILGLACDAVNSAEGDVISGLITAAGRNPQLATALHDSLVETKKCLHQAVIGKAAARGEIPADTDPALLHEVLHSLVLSRKTWQNEPLTAEWARHVADDILLPVLRWRQPATAQDSGI
jgi:AcrR family transcriptional regulator